MGTKEAEVIASVVTFDSEPDLPGCFESLRRQSLPVERTLAFDNASTDRSVQIARDFGAQVESCERNVGFSAGHNFNILKSLEGRIRGEERAGSNRFFLFLNPDVRLQPDYLARLIEASQQVESVGLAGGKLLRMDSSGEPALTNGFPVIDSAGIYFTPSQRHFDRGSSQADRGQFEHRQTVFGITGAALLCREGMVRDLLFEGEFFDEDFFTYREDADLSWRARLRGWEALYEPSAVAHHRRTGTPERRRRLDPQINFHSVKNRYLMRWKNMDWAVRLKCFPAMWLRDLAIACYVPIFERTSLGVRRELRRLRPRFAQKRAHAQAGRRVSPLDMARWFSFRPRAVDV
jgi:GT2 family glycosyltransferase